MKKEKVKKEKGTGTFLPPPSFRNRSREQKPTPLENHTEIFSNGVKSEIVKTLCCQFVCLNLQFYMLMRLKNLDNLQNIFSPWVAAWSEHPMDAFA